MARRQLILRHKWALGDTVLLTGLCRDIHRTYPGEYEVLVDTHFREVFDGHPHARILDSKQPASNLPRTPVLISYKKGIKAAGTGMKVHMLSWYHRAFSEQTGLALHPTEPKGDLHLKPEELPPLVSGRYWLVLPGGKLDATVKIWWPHQWQATVDTLAGLGVKVVQAGARHGQNINPSLGGVVDMVGKTKSSREFFNLVYHAEGVICTITAAMHIAACYDKPCVVVAGGREEPWWEGYTNAYPGSFGPQSLPVRVPHRYLHTIGLLDCCKKKGCWQHRTVQIGRKDQWDNSLCKLPVRQGVAAAPKCLDMITPDHVVEAVMSYYEDGTLPPIAEPTGKYRPAENKIEVRAPEPPPADVKKVEARRPPISLPGLGFQKTVLEIELTPEQKQHLENIRKWQGESRETKIMLGAPRIADPRNIGHPTIGGKLTICVLCYGDHFDLAKQCLDSIFNTIPAERVDVRVGLNAVCDQTRDYVHDVYGSRVREIYDHPENAKKYPVMREMFHDPLNPISTKYVVWFDDDAKIVNPDMWSELCDTIVANHPHGSRLYGNLFIHDLSPYGKKGDPLQWFRRASWWKNQDLKVKGRGQYAPNGTVIDFPSGWFWAIAAEAIRSGDVPCPRLNHNGGDITIGAQVRQAGFKVKQFNAQKQLVWCPSKENGGRRGYAEPFPWAK